MKKRFVSIFCFLISLALTLTGCTLCYEFDGNAIDNFDVGYSDELDDAFVATYHWDGSDDTKNIVIPEEYNGMKITSLGGYTGTGLPHAFSVDPEQFYLKNYEDDVNQWFASSIYRDIGTVETVYLNFNIRISKNIEQIKCHTLDCFSEGVYFDGEEYHSKIMIVFLYHITCDEENEIFYAKDGKLYYRENDSLVSDILYYDHDFGIPEY